MENVVSDKKPVRSKKKPVREAILDAAVDLVEAKGAGAMTLDAVAARAGVSKGGLMHHFKSKEALLTELIERVANTFEQERQASVATLVANAGGGASHEVELMMTYLDRAFAGLGARNQGAMALFAAAVHQPSLLQPVRDYFARRTAETLQHSRSPKAALAVMMLADGLWLFDALGIPEFNGALREDIAGHCKDWMRQILEDEAPVPATKSTPAAKAPKSAAAARKPG